MQMKDYPLGDTIVRYMIDESDNVSLTLIPSGTENKIKKSWDREPAPFNPRARHLPSRKSGSLVYFQLSDRSQSRPGITMKNFALSRTLKFSAQTVDTNNGRTVITTTLKSDEGFVIVHTLTHYAGLRGFEIETTFKNESGVPVTLEMLTSFVLDNLSPYQIDDAPNKYRFHRFYGGWSLEGKHSCMTIEDMGMEKSWAGFSSPGEKFGCQGSYPVERYFPAAVFEDTEHGVLWAAQLAHNASWQMELTRRDDYLSFSGGLGDFEYCGWQKTIENNESFTAPKSFVSAVSGDIYDTCAAVTDMQKNAYKNYGERGLPICFNEFCATWGQPTQEKTLGFCNALKDFDVQYLVVDAGWTKTDNAQDADGEWQDGMGEWNVSTSAFPDMKAMNDEIRKNGMIPGIWFEMEVTTQGSRMFEAEYDHMHLKRNGNVIKVRDTRSYWDFRRADVREYLREKVIHFLKKYGFGYIKVDYNANTGPIVDGAESGAEGLRQHLAAVRGFFEEMKREIPDLIIENCASGGHRLEPSMLGVSAVSSSSDAHEAVEIPYVSANLHNLMLPVQSLIWAVLHDDDDQDRMVYSLAATFLGRMCLSGVVDKLNNKQRQILYNAIDFYKKLDDVMINGDSKIYGNRGPAMRYPTGTQIVLRKTDKQILVVCHAFDNPGDEFSITIPDNAVITHNFYSENIKIDGNQLIIQKMRPMTAEAVLITL